MPQRSQFPLLAMLAAVALAAVEGCSSAAPSTEQPTGAAPDASPSPALGAMALEGSPSPALGSPPDAATVAPTSGAASAAETEGSTAAPTLSPSSATAEPLPSAAAQRRVDYDSNDAMRRVYSGFGHEPQTTLDAIADAVAENDVSLTPVIVEAMRFWSGGGISEAYRNALRQFTGQDFWSDIRPWNDAMEWLAPRRAEFAPPSEYLEWKASLLGLIDPRMAAFITSVPGSERIDLTEVVWGGVRTDGIPDLRSPPTLAAADAHYLAPRDRVFGVSINGEHRAYPLRIMNPHEMANDTLGGEPIALAY